PPCASRSTSTQHAAATRRPSDLVENADHRGADALAELGAPAGLVTLYGVVPRVAGRFTALSLYRWEVIVRDSVVLGIVGAGGLRSEEHTSELQSRENLVCRLLLE